MDSQARTVADSRTTMTELVLPNHANTLGNVLGGKVMHLLDLAAAIAASRHCRMPVVTVSVDSVRFLHPVQVGDVMILEAVMTRAFNTSMELRVQVWSENLLTGERIKTCTAFLTFVALKNGKPAPVPPLKPEDEEEERRYDEASERRKQRLKLAGRQDSES